MSDFEFNPTVISPLAGSLHRPVPALTAAGTLACPDTGRTASATATGLSDLMSHAAELSSAITDIADGLQECVEMYAASDNQASVFLHLRMGASVS